MAKREIIISMAASSAMLLSIEAFAQTGGTRTLLHRRSDERPFLFLNDDAMAKMMRGMAIQPSGDVDKDFAAMMIPHHQGAIDMAIAELRYGKNEQLRRIAQEIIVDQQQEISAMRLAVGEPVQQRQSTKASLP